MRAHNFNAGPAVLPLPVLEQIKDEMLDWQGSGMSVIEHSHRAKWYDAMHNETKDLFRELMGIPENYDILFIGGGATTQFAMVPMNLLGANDTGAYVLTGTWASKAYKEAGIIGKKAVVAASSKDTEFDHIPAESEIKLNGDERYLHICSNNTIRGTEWQKYPQVSVPLVCDMSSDILSRKVDVSAFELIYAGAQKNIGPAGVTVVIGKKEVLAADPEGAPTYMRYKTHLDNNSLYNTIPVFPVYVINLVLKWIKSVGGLDFIEKNNIEKANLVYNCIDNSNGFYRGTVQKDSRSKMNIPFRLQNEELEALFLKEAAANRMNGLKGHRSVGGIRASVYNACPLESVKALVDFMNDFAKKNG